MARGGASMEKVSRAAGISLETLRKVETGRIPTPAFFTVAAVARVLGLSMDELASTIGRDEEQEGRAAC
jgi:transcriptional regulator with XRE-family HTH domain